MAPIFEYFVVCGLGPEIRTLDGDKGYHGVGVLYLPTLLDQYPPENHTLYPPPPPQLPTCVLPAGVEIFSTGFDVNDPSTAPRSYPIVLTEGDGSKIYVSCIAFRDPVSEDIAEAYRIPPDSFADKCICLVSRSPSIGVIRNALEELFALCFSSDGSSKPLWDVIAHLVSNVPLPTPGRDRVLFAIENCLLSVDPPPKDGLPHADSLIIPCLLGVKHVYIPLLFFSGVDYIDAPTPYMMGLHSGVDTSHLAMDGVSQFLDTHGFLDFLERTGSLDESDNNLLDKLQDAIGRGQNPMSILPSSSTEPEIVTISDPSGGRSGSGAKYIYDRFPSNIRSEEQEEKRKQILAAASGAFEYIQNAPNLPSVQVGKDALSPMERAVSYLYPESNAVGLWLRLLKLGATDDPLSSFEYGTILALIESDAEGIGGSGFIECISEHIHTGWQCQLTDEQFIAVKELLKTAIGRATSRNDMSTIRDALEVSAEMYKKDSNNVPDFVQRHLISLSIWEELRFWEGFFDYLIERSSDKSANYAAQVTSQLILMASHMAGLGISDTDAWYMIETISEKNRIGYKQLIQLRGFLTHIQQLRVGYWGVSSVKTPSMSSLGLTSPRPKDGTDENQQPAEASVVGRSWVQSMFSRDSSRVNSFARVRKWTSDGASDASAAGQKKLQTNVRVLRGHNGAVTALHCVTRREVWDLVGDREDAGFFISGSTDCMVKIWDPSIRGSELRATLEGHKRTVRAISSDRGKVVSGSDDQTVIVWDKQTTQLLEELKGHEAQVSCVRMLSGERVLTAAHDGTVKMWDVRTDTCVATVGRCSSAVLCMEYDDSTGILAAAGRDASVRMVGDTLITGSDDWTARVWSVSRGTCDAVLACHAGPILCVEYSAADRGIITGSTDGLLRFWENDEGGLKCMKNVTIHSASILSINAGEHWLGVGAADNSMSLFNRPQDRLGGVAGSGSKLPGWQLYRTPQKMVAMVRCVASDLERKRICSGGRNGVLRFQEIENGGNSEDKKEKDDYSAVIRELEEDCDGCTNGGLENTGAELDTTVPAVQSGSNKYEFVSSGEMMTGFMEEPRVLKFTVYEQISDDERFESYVEKDFQGDEFDAENGWDFFDRSLIEKLMEVQKRNAKFIDDDDDDDDDDDGPVEEEEEEEEGMGFDSDGFSTEEEFEWRGLESVSENMSTEEELMSEIEGVSDLGKTGDVEEKKETVETEKTEGSVSGVDIEVDAEEEEASGQRLTVEQNSFLSEEAENFPTEKCVSPIKEYHFFPYRTIYDGSDPRINLGASIDEGEEVKKMESVQPPEFSDSDVEIQQQNQEEEDNDYEEEEEFIELDPGNRDSASFRNDDERMEQEPVNPVEPSIEETRFSSSYESDEDYTDSLWEHSDIVEQLKMELRQQARTGGLPTILEESETEEPSIPSPQVVHEQLKPWKIDDEKVEYKDLIDSIHKVYRNYSDKMKKLDILNFQTMHAAGLLHLKDTVLSQPPRRNSIQAMVLHNWCKLGKVAAEPMRKIVTEMQRDFEVVYVGQLCLSWEMLHWQFCKSLELMKFDSSSRSSRRYNQVAGEFQLFQVLVQRFVENEPFQSPKNRVQSYVKDRCVVRNLLQVPMIKEDSLKEEKEKEEGDYELVITSEMLVETIDRSTRLFWEFLRNENNSLTASQPHTDSHDQDTMNSELLQEVRTEFHKKDKKLKEILKTGNCLLKKFQRQQHGSQEFRRQRELVVAQVELKLVSRVLSMNRITAEQLIWCHEKLGKVRLSNNRKVSVEPSFLLFPC
ncbi:unnamed protein product [Linum tenue]|uniref:UDENN domain-containing protein n=1 Tax=Linum tenue TaxID=586396 RepID=A0AAV0LUZ3_9ROSI|nr:unnamed protein product [Linum tenue]